jgi:DNA repair photolyase
MIISVSRRTDIPAFYSDWFFKRIQEGFVLVRNPMNPHQIKRVSLKRDAVDCIVFWTKNPEDMLPKLDLLDGYPFYFQFTVNPYDKAIEPGVPGQLEVVDTFRRLSEALSPERVIWRYDPVFLNESMDLSWHEKHFAFLADRLHDYTSKCVFSFIDYYKKVDKCFKENRIKELEDGMKEALAIKFAAIAGKYGLKLETCAEEIDLSSLGIGHASCIDPVLLERLSGIRSNNGKDRNQREACGCCPSVDIGTYNTCRHGCIYCYANHNPESVKRNCMGYDPDSPLLCSIQSDKDKIF